MKPTINILIILSFFIACKGSKDVVKVIDSENIETPFSEVNHENIQYSNLDIQDSQVPKNEILFLGFNMHQDSSLMIQSIILNEIFIKEGRVKHSDLNQARFTEGNLVCILYDVNDTVLYQLIIENPLIQSLEYYKDDGNFGRTIVYQNDAYFMLKVPNDRKYHHISFKYISDNYKMNEIGTVMLNLK